MPNAEQVYVLWQGIPFPCEMVPGRWGNNGVSCLRLLEDVGRREAVVTDAAETFFPRGTLLVAEWDGHSRHATTGGPVFRLIDPP
jgi:hypothetical protein